MHSTIPLLSLASLQEILPGPFQVIPVSQTGRLHLYTYLYVMSTYINEDTQHITKPFGNVSAKANLKLSFFFDATNSSKKCKYHWNPCATEHIFIELNVKWNQLQKTLPFLLSVGERAMGAQETCGGGGAGNRAPPRSAGLPVRWSTRVLTALIQILWTQHKMETQMCCQEPEEKEIPRAGQPASASLGHKPNLCINNSFLTYHDTIFSQKTMRFPKKCHVV